MKSKAIWPGLRKCAVEMTGPKILGPESPLLLSLCGKEFTASSYHQTFSKIKFLLVQICVSNLHQILKNQGDF